MEELCKRYQETLGESDVPPELAEHAARCAVCREFRQKHEALLSALPAWETPGFSADFTLTVMSRIAEETARRHIFRDLLRSLFSLRLPVPLPVGAAAVLLLIGSTLLNVFLWNRGNDTQEKTIPGYHITRSTESSPAVKNASHDRLTVPREWLGSGGFLVIPLGVSRDFPYAAWAPGIEPETDSTTDQGKI